jgi:hypothetical protein
MPAEKVKGLDAMIKFNVHGSMEAYCYAKSFELNITPELIGVSTIGDGQSKQFKPKRYSYTITMDALVLLTDDSPKVTSPDLLEQALGFVQTPFEILYTGESGGILSIRGNAWINNLSFTANPTGFISKNVQMQGTGPLVRGNTPVTMVTLTMEVITSPGAVSMNSIIITDSLGVQTTVHAGVITNGTSVTASIPAGTYHIRATLDSDRPYNLFYSDAAPGFSDPLNGAQVGTVYFPYPPNSPIWDFTVNRFLRWQGSNTPLA